jgi:hypothetical protein
MSKGWIYLIKDSNSDGSAKHYKFGLTSSPQRRYRKYKTESPSAEVVEDYETNEMHLAENELKAESRKRGWLIYPQKSNEWISPDHINSFLVTWNKVKSQYSIEGIKIAKQQSRPKVRQFGIQQPPMVTESPEEVARLMKGVWDSENESKNVDKKRAPEVTTSLQNVHASQKRKIQLSSTQRSQGNDDVLKYLQREKMYLRVWLSIKVIAVLFASWGIVLVLLNNFKI